MDIDRIGAIVKILRGAVFAEEVGTVKLETASNAGIELRRTGVPGNRLQGAEVVPSVEVVYPPL